MSLLAAWTDRVQRRWHLLVDRRVKVSQSFVVAAAVAVLFLVNLGICTASQRAQDESLTKAREKMVVQLVRDLNLKDDRVIAALRKVPRHVFVPRRQRASAYLDESLPLGFKQTISAPWAVAYMTERLAPQPTDRVLEIGTGSGYQAAVLSELAAEVYTIEIVEPLGRRAQRTLEQLGYENVHVKIGDGFLGWPEKGPFDKIIVTCSPESVPQPLIDQLKDGGRMLVPVGERYQQKLYLMEKIDGKLVQQELIELVFVPMTGKAESLRQQQPDPAHPQLVNGDFEKDENDDGQPDGWHYRRQSRLASAGSPQKKFYLEFHNEVPGQEALALQACALDGRFVRALDVSLWVRLEEVQPATEQQRPQLVVTFYDEQRHSFQITTIGSWSGTSDWQRHQGMIEVPSEAREAIFRLGLSGATGKVGFDDIHLQAQPRQRKQPLRNPK